VYRTGLCKVGIPGATQGLQAEDPTIAQLLKNHGYATGQFGKNHLGDRNEFLPTVHGFDEFFGNLYHLNAEEEPELPDYPSAEEFPEFRTRFGPRGVMRCHASETDDPTTDERFGRVGKQVIEDTGPLTRKRMETCDDEFSLGAQDFIKRQNAVGRPWFCWLNTTHMHLRTHPKPESVGHAGRWQSPYHDTMIGCWCAGRARFRPVSSATKWSSTTTGCRHLSRPLVTRKSSTSCSTDTKLTAGRSRSISMATTYCRT